MSAKPAPAFVRRSLHAAPFTVMTAALLALTAPAAEAQFGRVMRDVAQRAAEREAGRQVDRVITNAIRCAVGELECFDRARADGQEVVFVGADGEIIVDGDGQPITSPDQLPSQYRQAATGESLLPPGEGAGATAASVVGTRTGDVRATIDGEAVELATFVSDEGNTAAWLPLGDDTFAVFVNAYADEQFALRGAFSIRLVVADVDMSCPCTPEEVVIRQYRSDAADADFYESQNVTVSLSRLERVDADTVTVAGTFSGTFVFRRTLGGRAGNSTMATGTFEARATRVQQ